MFPSELAIEPAEGGELPPLMGDLDRAADEFMKRAAATDPDAFARIAARYPTVSLRSLRRPRRVRFHGKSYEVRDVHFDDEGGAISKGGSMPNNKGAPGPATLQVYRTWLEDTWA